MNLKSNIKNISCALIGILHFVWLALPFMTVSVSGKMLKVKGSFSGYNVMAGEFKEANAAALVVVFQVLAIICAVALILSAMYLLVKEILKEKVPEKIGPVEISKVLNISLLAYAVVNIGLLASEIIVCIANAKSTDMMKLGYGIGFGPLLTVFFAVGAFVAFAVIEKKYPELLEGGTSVKSIWVCDQCGASAKKGTAFCGACGGSVSEKVIIPTMLVCSSCGAKGKKGVAFCSKCGGQIVEKPVPTYACEACGEPSKKDVAFCAKCGGKIIEK